MSRRAKLATLLLAAGCWMAFCLAPVALGSSLPSGFRDEVVFKGLEEPTNVRFAPGGKVFVAEKAGKIVVFDSLEDTTPTVFADLRTDVYDTGDRGILGLAVDPHFSENHHVYALYTYDHLLSEEAPAPKWGKPNESGDGCDPKPSGTGVDACPVSGRLVQLTANGDHAVEEGGQVRQKVLVEDWCQQFSSHSIGDLQFDASGNLYASGGDGSDANNPDYGQTGWPEKNQCGDPPAGVGGNEVPPTAEGGALRAQDARTPPNPLDPTADPTDLNGALIRISPDTGEGLPGNPLSASIDPNERRIVAYGFRNPFRFAIDPVGEELYVDNVGWNNYEEIDRLPTDPATPFDSGWPCYEGPGPNAQYKSLGLNICENLYAEPSATTLPFFYYKHDVGVTADDPCPAENGSAISGIAFYGGGSFPPAYDGALFFADSVRGCIYVMLPGIDGRPDPLSTTTFMSEAGPYPGVDLEIGPGGDLYYVSLFAENSPGEEFGLGAVHRISFDPDVPTAHLTADPQWGNASVANPLEVHFDASASTDPNGKPLSYEWDLDGNGEFEGPDESEVTGTYTAHKNVTVSVRVSNGASSNVAQVTVYPGDTPPAPTIEEPADEGFEWHVGQKIHFSGAAHDGEDGDLAPSSLSWNSRLFHCPSAGCHVHPLQSFPEVSSGTLIAPDHDFPSHIELTLTATDSRGLAASRSIQLNPREVDLQFATDPPGLSLSAGEQSEPGPFTLRAIEDASVVLSAPQTEELGGKTFTWQRWSDGGERVHTVVADAPATYTAFYSGPESPLPPPPPPPPTPPRTRIEKRPSKLAHSSTARFVFSSDQSGAGFRCKLDRKQLASCRSPRLYRHLEPGGHEFRVVAISPTGVADPTPSVFRWSVAEKPAQPAP